MTALPFAEQPSVDGDEAQSDQRHAADLEQRQPLAEEEETEQHRAGRDDQGDQRGIGGAGRGDEVEIEDIGEGGRQSARPSTAAQTGCEADNEPVGP